MASALILIGAQPASAATQVGSNCVGNAPAIEYSAVSIANPPGDPLPATIPAAGVVTSWSISVTGEVPPNLLSQTLKIFRPAALPGQFQVVAQSPIQLVVGGINTFATRLSVAAGDHIGNGGAISGKPFALICETKNIGNVIGIFGGDPPVGSTATLLGQEAGLGVPIVATVEADADNDGFGDETQDKCPQSPAIQGECPVVTVEAASVIKEKKSVVVLVTSSYPAPVSVTGTVNLGKGKKAKLSSKAKTVSPGAVTRFKLGFTKALKKKLVKLPKSKTLPLKVTVSATDSIGRVTTDTAKAALKGQAKPVKKSRAGGR